MARRSCSGAGQTYGADKPKQYLTLNNQPILAHTLARLHAAFPQARLVLCLDSDDRWFDPTWVPFAQWQRVSGGAERMHSVLNALQAMTAEDSDLVMVHDVALRALLVMISTRSIKQRRHTQAVRFWQCRWRIP